MLSRRLRKFTRSSRGWTGAELDKLLPKKINKANFVAIFQLEEVLRCGSFRGGNEDENTGRQELSEVSNDRSKDGDEPRGQGDFKEGEGPREEHREVSQEIEGRRRSVFRRRSRLLSKRIVSIAI